MDPLMCPRKPWGAGSDAKRLKQAEDGNRRLKRIVADQALDIQMLKEVNSRNW